MENKKYGEFDLKHKLLKGHNPLLSHSGVNAERLASRFHELAQIGLTNEKGSRRIGFSFQEFEAKELVKKWMIEAGLVVQVDGAGNVFGKLVGKDLTLPSILSGSHVDSVPNGGHFDGPLGVLAALEVVEAWKETSFQPRKSFEVVIFSDEEGSRFDNGLLGSQAMSGELNMTALKKVRDFNGEQFESVLIEAGLTLEGFTSARRDYSSIEAYIEVHIEQGKQLEKEDLPVGIVSGIAGPCWLQVTFTGESNHAGNTPMVGRQDALVAASKFIERVSELPKTVSDTAVATVGKLQVFPNGSNVIPGKVILTVDIRDIDLNSRDTLVEKIVAVGNQVENENAATFEYEELLRIAPVLVDESLKKKAEKACIDTDIRPFYLPSGAAHDAMVLGKHIPMSMLFVRSLDGISHNPREFSSLDDCVYSVHVLKKMIEQLNK
ncbi:M20 family metallo-hydrolase [Halalkalibacter alkaliphilus]|uniref:M20 family metallo-hydrolase n=1 Tax=Halalkalibacter alkaliphilus TaxID=2917993 RepID=A0A9X2IA44_9BACI|nr:M20 family metallo-hydrolase [Halalkalibacter alkaliphilus]MCL7749844.1 M20 family metallo-hydrolase [Halalkalibacter alkaliphilus]